MKPFTIQGHISKGIASVTIGDATETHEVENEWECSALLWLALLENNPDGIPKPYRASAYAHIVSCAEELWRDRVVYKLIVPSEK